MFALVDCNNFYVSCERLFRPELWGKPVVVLSNNDGIIISRSQEVKDLGIKMGSPWHLLAPGVQKQITSFSSNYTLYADLSARVMTNLARFTPEVEVYSIDECFLSLHGFSNLRIYAAELRETIIRNTGIPISVGVAPSKSLAKLANKLAKKNPAGVCVLDTPEKITQAIDQYPVDDLWGIGKAYCKKLSDHGILTAGQFREQPLDWVKTHLTILGVRMWYELWGRSCIPLTTVIDRKKAICSSRSFAHLTSNFTDLEEATIAYTSRLAEKLRSDRSCAQLLSVKLITNIYRKDLPQYFDSITLSLDQPCNNTAELVKYALRGLKQIFREGFQFLKVEVTATGLVRESEVQLNMFDQGQKSHLNKASEVLDKLNRHYGKGTVRIAGEGYTKSWGMKRQFLSRPYTTNWKDIIKVT